MSPREVLKRFEYWEILAMIDHQAKVNNEYKKQSRKNRSYTDTKTVEKSNDLTRFILEE